MKRIHILLLIITIMLLTSCVFFTQNGVFSYDNKLFLFSDSSIDSTTVAYFPLTTSEFKSKETNNNYVVNMNTSTSLNVIYDTSNNQTKGWNPEEDFWAKIEFPQGQTVYALMESYSKSIEDENINSISIKLCYGEVITVEEKDIFIDYIKDQIEQGNNWAAMSQSETDTELWVGDY